MVWRRSSGALLLAAVLARGESRFEAVEPHMGVPVRITLYARDSREAAQAFERAFARVRKLDARLSDYNPASELSSLGSRPRHVSEDLRRVLAGALRVAVESDGAYDPTLGALTKLWRQARRTGRLPAEAAVAEALRRCGYRRLTLTDGKARVEPGTQLDLGGIAKGFAAGEALRASGIKRAIVAIDGDLALGEAPPGEPGWRIGIQPLAELHKLPPLSNVCVSTSGDTGQSLTVGGVRYSHILDPRTGIGMTGAAGATVIAKDCAVADAAATALRVLRQDRGKALAAALGVAALLETPDGRITTGLFPPI